MQSHMRPVSGVRRVAAGLLVAALNASGPALAQEAAAQPPASPPVVPAPASQLLLPYGGSTLERYFARLRIDFSQLDADLDGKITQRDIELHALMEVVMLRTFALQFVMGYDLDGDGAVTEDEIRRAVRYYRRTGLKQTQKEIDDTVRSTMALDTDKDGKVSVSEAGKFTSPEMQRDIGSSEAAERARRALTLESGTKGEITLQEYEAAGEALFRKVDTDHDGKVSPHELDDYRRTSAVSAPRSGQPR
jgi:Ca2+-binding EF-hand superfamily protein